MMPETLGMELERLLARMGVELRLEPLDEEAESWGGLCRLYGRSLLIIDPRLSLEERNRHILDCLELFDLDQLYVPPFIREQMDRGNKERETRIFDIDRSGPGNTP